MDSPIEPIQINRNQFPYSDARSTRAENQALLAALLTSDLLDEISDAEGMSAVRRYITSRGHVNKAGYTITGLAFWLYPTGLHGPYHETEDGSIRKHGALITMERGVHIEGALEIMRTKELSSTNDIIHEHIAASARG